MFGLFRKPPSRLELIKQGVAGAAGHAYDTLTDTLSHVPVDKLDDVRHNLAGTAAQAWDTASRVAAERAAAARDAAADAADKAAAAREAALKTAAEQVDSARERASAAQATARERATAAMKAAQERIPSRKQVEAVQEDAREEVVEAVPDVEITTDEGVSKWLWLGLGLLVGVVIGVLLAPNAGRRSRALLQDKVRQAGQGAADLGTTAATKAADLGSRAAGLAQSAKAKVQGEEDDADDITIADRVRTALGEHETTAHLQRINVDCVDGVVTLRGPMLDEATQQAVTAVVAAVKGVREVKNDFLTADAPEDSATFVG